MGLDKNESCEGRRNDKNHLLGRFLYICEIMDNIKAIGIDLFAGAGGMSLGAEMAGISVEYAVEIDRYAAETYKANHLHTKVINADVRNVTSFDCCSHRVPVVLFGGAPCQGFSTSNRRTNTRSNPDNWLYKEFVRLLKQVRPDWVVFENVTGLLDMESGSFFQSILDDFSKVGYSCSYSVLTASDYGVPQNRSRLFIIGSRHGERVSFTPVDVITKVSVQDAFSDLPILENGANVDVLPYAKEADNDFARLMRSDLQKCSGHLVSRNATYILERYKHVKQGENWAAIPKMLMQNYADPTRCHTGIYYRLKEDQPSVVIGNYRKNMIIHPTCDRGLSVREAARLQSFPDWYTFKGSIGFQQQQVGNAVPPLLAKHVFRTILREI